MSQNSTSSVLTTHIVQSTQGVQKLKKDKGERDPNLDSFYNWVMSTPEITKTLSNQSPKNKPSGVTLVKVAYIDHVNRQGHPDCNTLMKWFILGWYLNSVAKRNLITSMNDNDMYDSLAVGWYAYDKTKTGIP